MQQFIFYISWIVFPLMVFFLVGAFWFKSEIYKTICVILLILSAVFTYTRFIETQLLAVEQTKINLGFKTKIALISDLDLGVYNNRDFLQKVVDKINTLDVRFVFIAGGFTYFPQDTSQSAFEKQFNPLKDIKFPIYAVLGNHDLPYGNEDYRKNLQNALTKNNVKLLLNDFISFQDFTLVGLGENLRNDDDVKILNKFSSDQNVVVLTHNPETVKKYENSVADLTLAGFTHGSQLRIPFLTDYLNRDIADKGLTRINNHKLFVTTGIGETVLPMRLFNSPVIDLITID